MASATAVPNAAPPTPSPAPGRLSDIPASSIVRVGNIRKKLKMTSSTHIATPITLGTRIFPLQRNIAPARKLI